MVLQHGLVGKSIEQSNIIVIAKVGLSPTELPSLIS